MHNVLVRTLAVLGFTVPALPAWALTPDHRLGREAVPLFQAVELQLDSRKPDYSGSVRIALHVEAVSDSFQLHAMGMRLERLSLKAGRRAIPTTHATEDHGVLTVHTAQPLEPGDYALEIEFSNDFDTRANSLYRLETGGESYSFTQFQAAAAREAFPCFDEPEFKIPWEVTLVVPRGHLAVSNTPITREKLEGEWRKISFKRTPPMPSYLVALATGPLETVEIPGMSVPGRVVTVRGARHLAGEAVRWTPRILAALEGYFGSKHPYAKLDLLALPEFWPGAMENPGAITFRDDILLLEPARVTVQERRRLVTVIAHEIAHMWFGDLVTMEWWDDLWLNESFASWLGDKISHQVAPELEVAVGQVQEVQNAFALDARLSTRAIRQPVDGFDNLEQLADALAYDKGQAVLGMLEQWLGEEPFRRGVQAYLKAHAWKSARGSDLWNSLAKSSGRDVAAVAISFLDQPGVPLVEVSPVGMNQVRLRQRRFHGPGVNPPAPGRWQIPVSLRYSDGVEVRTHSVLLSEPEMTITLPSRGTPTWVYPNADEKGYYRWSAPTGSMRTLQEAALGNLTPRERVGFVGNAEALLKGGVIGGDDYLRLLARLGTDPHPRVAHAVLEALETPRAAFVTPELTEAFGAYVRRMLAPALQRIGPEPRTGEPEGVSLLRPRLLRWLGESGRDEGVLERARELADSYLSDPTAVDASIADAALDLSAIRGDGDRFETYRRRFEQAQIPADRRRFLAALGSFRDPALMDRALAYSLSGPVRPQETFSIGRQMARAPENHDRFYRWTTENFETLRSRVPPSFVPFMVFSCGGCSSERLEAGRSFFTPLAAQYPGIKTNLDRVSDQVRECVDLRARQGEAVAHYLTDQAAAK